jgi:hypothetical protein
MPATEMIPFLALLIAVAAWVSAPVRRGHAEATAPSRLDLAALEAERDVRLAAVREAELERDTGKISAADHAALDEQLRAEAVEALRALEAAKAREAGR